MKWVHSLYLTGTVKLHVHLHNESLVMTGTRVLPSNENNKVHMLAAKLFCGCQNALYVSSTVQKLKYYKQV
jgi:hypothetical protein